MAVLWSRRAVLVGLMGGMLGACGMADGTRSPDRASAGTRKSGAQPTAAPAPTAPVELVWHADGGPDQLLRPAGLAVDRRGTLTVVDAGNNRLVQFTSTGEVVARLGRAGSAPGQFRFSSPPNDYPDGVSDDGVALGVVAVDAAGALYVADPFNARVQRVDPAGQVVADWGPLPPPARLLSEAHRLYHPVSIAVDDRHGHVFVADHAGHLVHAFDRDGHWRLAWGGLGHQPGQFIRPLALAVDRQGQVVVADSGNARIQVFDAGGRLVTTWDAGDPTAQEFPAPLGVAVDGADRVYVATAHGVQVFTTAGVYLAAWNDADGERFVPNGIAVDEHDAVYVTDLGRSRVLKFRARGPWPTPAAGRPTPRPALPTATPPPPMSPTPRPFMTPTDR
jgi:sugar lactone lactonase YvrE